MAERALETQVILTPLDVERLLTDPSEDSRVGVLQKVADHYNHHRFGTREHEIAEQIFRLLMKDVALHVRETLAQRIKDNDNIPRDIALHMAADVDSVALPMLAESKVFSDADLVSIIEASRDISKLLTISQRDGVSHRVSDALVETRYPQVVSTLLSNETAAIGERTLERIVTDFRSEAGVMTAMVERNQLPLSIVERLVTEASTSIADQLKAKYSLSEDQLKKEAGNAREDVLLKLLSREVSDAEVNALVTQMAEDGRLTPSLAMTALSRGLYSFFASALAKFANVPFANAQRLLADKGELGFRGIYNRAGLPEGMYEAIRLIVRAVQELEGGEALPGSMLYANRLAERVLYMAGTQNIEYLPYFIALIRQNIPRH